MDFGFAEVIESVEIVQICIELAQDRSSPLHY